MWSLQKSCSHLQRMGRKSFRLHEGREQCAPTEGRPADMAGVGQGKNTSLSMAGLVAARPRLWFHDHIRCSAFSQATTTSS